MALSLHHLPVAMSKRGPPGELVGQTALGIQGVVTAALERSRGVTAPPTPPQPSCREVQGGACLERERRWEAPRRPAGPEASRGRRRGPRGARIYLGPSHLAHVHHSPRDRKTRQEVHNFTTHQPQDTPHTKLSREGYMKMASSTV